MDWFLLVLFGCIVLLNVMVWLKLLHAAWHRKPSESIAPSGSWNWSIGGTSEWFRIEPRANGVGFIIYWGPTHICEMFTDRGTAERLCAILEALRAADNGGDPERIETAWQAFRDARNQGRWGE